MDIQSYLSKLNAESQIVFNKTTQKKEALGTLHHLSSCIYEFSDCLIDPQEKQMLITVSSQLESATLSLVLGLYRQAFTSLRLALEMGLATIYFSINKMELHEWINGYSDIKWHKIIDEENGVLSPRFSKAFFKECSSHSESYRSKAKSTYRKLSEYVHGNRDTWHKSGIDINYKNDLIEFYLEHFKCVSEVIIFSAICRYAKLIDESNRESLQFIPEQFNHITEIRNLFGRQ